MRKLCCCATTELVSHGWWGYQNLDVQDYIRMGQKDCLPCFLLSLLHQFDGAMPDWPRFVDKCVHCVHTGLANCLVNCDFWPSVTRHSCMALLH